MRTYKHRSSAIRAGRRISQQLLTDAFVILEADQIYLLTGDEDREEFERLELPNVKATQYYTYEGHKARGGTVAL